MRQVLAIDLIAIRDFSWLVYRLDSGASDTSISFWLAASRKVLEGSKLLAQAVHESRIYVTDQAALAGIRVFKAE